MRRSTKLLAVLACAAVLGLSSRAQAGLIPVNVTVLPDGTNWRWVKDNSIPTT